MYKLIAIILLLSFNNCSIDRTIIEISETEKQILAEFQNLDNKSKLIISDENEPGQKLLLCLTFVNKMNKKVLPDQPVKFYHTSDLGTYEPADPDDETTSRLNGLSTTNDEGKIYVETILPGGYGRSEDNRHIHTTVYGAKPEAYDINFYQYTGRMGRKFINGSDQHFLADLKKTGDNILVCFLIIEVKNPDEKISAVSDYVYRWLSLI